jgi:hypothetical protein
LKTPWTLPDVIDLEALIARDVDPSAGPGFSAALAQAGSDPGAARRAGLRAWLVERRTLTPDLPGAHWQAARLLVALLASLLLFVAGASVAFGLLDRARGGFNVPLFLAVTLGAQWLILLAAAAGWLLRRQLGASLALVPRALGALVSKVAGERRPAWWRALVAEGGRYRAVILWPLARITQAAAIAYNAGLLAGLGGCLWFLNVGFFWESTTPAWMQQRLVNLTSLLAAPWAWAEPGWRPDPGEIAATRIGAAPLDQILLRADVWYPFLLAAIAVWGMLPRVVLWLIAWRAGQRALATLDFQARRHRELWRKLTHLARDESVSRPMDGVLVLDVGGSGLSAASLRSFLLRRLRVNPTSWLPVAVLDQQSDPQVNAALAAAPAGVVLLAEGWALSPPRMRALHGRVRHATGPATPLMLLVANLTPEGQPGAPTASEVGEWTRFVDELGDPAAEVFFFGSPASHADA